jgi:hypothetical protein
MQNPNLNPTHLTTLRTILRRVNPYVNIFARVAECLTTNLAEEVHICITIGRTLRNKDLYCYNVLMTNKVAMIIPGDPREVGNCNVIIQRRYGGGFQRMNKLTPSYDPL